MSYNISLVPGLSPLDRGYVEDLVVDALGEGADVPGGGTFMGPDGPESDFDLELPEGHDPQQVIATLRRIMEGVGFSLVTRIGITRGGEGLASFEVGGEASASQ
jgi:hypothetical protein